MHKKIGTVLTLGISVAMLMLAPVAAYAQSGIIWAPGTEGYEREQQRLAEEAAKAEAEAIRQSELFQEGSVKADDILGLVPEVHAQMIKSDGNLTDGFTTNMAV